LPPDRCGSGANKQQVNAAVAANDLDPVRRRRSPGASGVLDQSSIALEDVTSFEEFGAVQSLLNRKFWTQWSRRSSRR
jgi:hypothetical protein